jgi:hypothetical protein
MFPRAIEGITVKRVCLLCYVSGLGNMHLASCHLTPMGSRLELVVLAATAWREYSVRLPRRDVKRVREAAAGERPRSLIADVSACSAPVLTRTPGHSQVHAARNMPNARIAHLSQPIHRERRTPAKSVPPTAVMYGEPAGKSGLKRFVTMPQPSRPHTP